MRLEHLALIGNCQFVALIARDGAVVWCCLPRFDSEPVFASLLDRNDGGQFLIGAAGGELGVQQYQPDTNVLETVFNTPDGAFRIIDLAPRLTAAGRTIRPTILVRIAEPIDGRPRIRVRCDPRAGWSKREPAPGYIDYQGFAEPVRLATDVPLSHLDGRAFALSARRHFVLSWGRPVDEPLSPMCDRLLRETVHHWRSWVRQCAVPRRLRDDEHDDRMQRAVMRSALALKLHCYEATGAIIASPSMAIPESPGSGRTWDYRYCWLRDAYYSLSAFRRLGRTEELDAFLPFALDIADRAPGLDLAPLYRIDGSSDLEEHILAGWPGMNDDGPVRIGNAAALQRQHDVYGEMVLALAPILLESRYGEERSHEVFVLLERLAKKAIAVAGTPDAGIWELRTDPKPRTFSSMMCWAAAHQMAIVCGRHRPALAQEFRQAADLIRREVVQRAWNPSLGSFVGSYGGVSFDASVLEMANLGFLPGTDRRLRATVAAIENNLARDGWVLRYAVDDGLGQPSVAYFICTFWLIQALVAIDKRREAAVLLEKVRAEMSPLGLLSEDFDPAEHRMWGNFPQAYSHVGLIHAAFAVASP